MSTTAVTVIGREFAGVSRELAAARGRAAAYAEHTSHDDEVARLRLAELEAGIATAYRKRADLFERLAGPDPVLEVLHPDTAAVIRVGLVLACEGDRQRADNWDAVGGRR